MNETCSTDFTESIEDQKTSAIVSIRMILDSLSAKDREEVLKEAIKACR